MRIRIHAPPKQGDDTFLTSKKYEKFRTTIAKKGGMTRVCPGRSISRLVPIICVKKINFRFDLDSKYGNTL
jgi:hypothetical protein